MRRPVTLCTSQWIDLPLEVLAKKASQWGFDGLELDCRGDHFDVRRAIAEPEYVQTRWDILNRHNLKCYAISCHPVGQAVCDLIDSRHKTILPAYIWGDGEPGRRLPAYERQNGDDWRQSGRSPSDE